MAILRDANGGIFKIHLCKYCVDLEGRPKPIMPDDPLAQRQNDGSYKWGTCIAEEIDSAIIKANPNSAKSQEILRRRQHEQKIDEMNKQLLTRC